MSKHCLPKQLLDALWVKSAMSKWCCLGRNVWLVCWMKYGVSFIGNDGYIDCKSVTKRCVESLWQDQLTLRSPLSKVSLHRYISWVEPKLVTSVSLKSPAKYLCFMLRSVVLNL